MFRWLPGHYGVAYRGATGGSIDPAQYQRLPGASHRHADQELGSRRSAFARVPDGGQAASLPPAVRGVLASDKAHSLPLDGHPGSAIANHPDGLFAMNTAATSDHSLHANYETFRGTLTGWNETMVLEDGNEAAQEHLTALSDPTRSVSTGTLTAQRAERLSEQPDLLVKDALPGSSRGFTGTQLAVGAIGLYAAYSVFARA